MNVFDHGIEAGEEVSEYVECFSHEFPRVESFGGIECQ